MYSCRRRHEQPRIPSRLVLAQHTAELSNAHESVVASASAPVVVAVFNAAEFNNEVDFNPTRSPKAHIWSLVTCLLDVAARFPALGTGCWQAIHPAYSACGSDPRDATWRRLVSGAAEQARFKRHSSVLTRQTIPAPPSLACERSRTGCSACCLFPPVQ